MGKGGRVSVSERGTWGGVAAGVPISKRALGSVVSIQDASRRGPKI